VVVVLDVDVVEVRDVLVDEDDEVELVLVDEEEVDVVDVEDALVLEVVLVVVLVVVVGAGAQVHSACGGLCAPLDPLTQTLQVSVAENAREKMRTSSIRPLNCRLAPPSLFPSSLTVMPVLQSAPVRATGGRAVPFTYSVRFAPSYVAATCVQTLSGMAAADTTLVTLLQFASRASRCSFPPSAAIRYISKVATLRPIRSMMKL
jgi:hypothetical protein